MRAVLQRVTDARVETGGQVTGAIGVGILVLLGVARGDNEQDVDYLVEKVLNLRIFPDEAGKLQRSVLDIGGKLLVVSQFTLLGDCRKGRRPSFDEAAPPDLAEELIHSFVVRSRQRGIMVATGIFQAKMSLSLVNDGPVTLILESKKP